MSRGGRVLVGTAAVVALAAVAWVALRGPGTTFGDGPLAERVAFARRDGDVLILYRRCDDDLIPYVDASEVIGGDLREWEVAEDVRLPDEASWMARRHAVGEAEPPPDEYEGNLPPPDEVRLNVHLYSASIEDRWHLRVRGLDVPELPEASIPLGDVLAADGETMSHRRWRARADTAC